MTNTSVQTTNGKNSRAFTLIEILVVLGLTTVLFALLLIPLVNSIRYTRQAQSVTAAQDAARITRERITRELGSALFVFDGTSHPFFLTSGVFAAGDDRYTNFLDLQILASDGTPVVAHAYNAKLDFVLPRVNDRNQPIDPTTNEPITYRPSPNGSAVISSPSLIFPAASGTTMIRYFVGLRDPSKPYNNVREGKANGSDDNTYILYRAQFQLSNSIDPATGKPTVNGDGTTINEKLFVPKLDTSGNVIDQPELDDPDFFRYVAPGDPNWLDDTHTSYTAATAGAQHDRVENWRNISKPVIPGPNVDMILLPHNSDGTLNYDTSGAFDGIAHSGVARDPVTNKSYPIINTSVTFRPATVSGSATPGTTVDYTSAGVPAVMETTGDVYIPTVYTASSRSWAQPYKVTLTPPAAPAGQFSGGATYYTTQDPATGDYYEYKTGSPDTVVFDITTGKAATGEKSYIPMSVNADTGTINFATPALPDPANRYTREWVYTPTPFVSASGPSYQVDLTKTDNNSHPSPLGTIVDDKYPTYHDAATNTDLPLYTARIVPGSLRVSGPDATPGPGQGLPVLYTEAGVASAPGDNQFSVDYAHSILTFSGPTNAGSPNATGQLAAAPIKVIYDYQANLVPVGTESSGKLTTYTLQPLGVLVDYQTRDLIDVSIGVRIYDLSTNRAQVIPAETKIKIGNSNR